MSEDAAEEVPPQDDEPGRIRDWRLSVLLAAGLEVGWAERIADDPTVDLHETVGDFKRLTERGASVALASQIVAPLAAVGSPPREHVNDHSSRV